MNQLAPSGAARDMRAEAITPESFAPFGRVIVATEDGIPAGAIDAALDLSQGRPRFYIMALKHRPLVVSGLTRHRMVTQVLASVGGHSWLLTVAPPAPRDDPDALPAAEDVRAFSIPGDRAVLLLRGCWHAGPFFHGDTMAFFNLELADTNIADHQTCALLPYFGHELRLQA